MERRHAAILAADVVGYAHLIRADEEGALAALKGLRADLVDPKTARNNGRFVKLMGGNNMRSPTLGHSLQPNHGRWHMHHVRATPDPSSKDLLHRCR